MYYMVNCNMYSLAFRPVFSQRLRCNSAEAQAFVAALLAVNPEDRLSAAQAPTGSHRAGTPLIFGF